MKKQLLILVFVLWRKTAAQWEIGSGIIVQEERSVPLFHIASKCADLHSDSVPYMSASDHDPPEAL